jgi:hypothetical protein
MRLTFLLIFLVVFGGLLAANLRIDNRALSSTQYQAVFAACTGCHGNVPSYRVASVVHNRHAAFNCSTCHSDIGGLRSADTVRLRLGWAGAGVAALALTGAVASLWVTNAKRKAK